MTMRILIGGAAIMVVLAAGTAQSGPLVDPTQPYRRVAAEPLESAPSGPVLQATRVSSEHKSAVISGRTVRVGDSIGGAMVVDIAPYEVRMDRAGREFVLRLAPKLAKEKGRAQ